ncbi:MAG: electron transfer flavoprotein subunit alpha [Bacteroidetes bacterium 4572_77]|nr:MAG: electron transfer flavoprotein subunit alpha [Bacteroidetes bacterium 4572_77]
MNNVFIYCELTEENHIADVSQELLTKGRSLANELGVKVEAVVIGHQLKGIEKEVLPFGVDIVHLADDKNLSPFTSGAHAKVLTTLLKQQEPQIALFGATANGRDVGPRIASALKCGLTADCTSLLIGDHEDKKANKTYKNLLYQVRPAFGGNIIATIINPETRPQIATVREGVMKKEIVDASYQGEVKNFSVEGLLEGIDLAVEIIDRHIEPPKVNIKGAQIIVSGGYGVGSAENFKMLAELAQVLGGEVGASRAAVDSGYAPHERQIGQTGVTVRPKLYIACGISGAVQHSAGMDESAQIISINTDPQAPINNIADYAITGRIEDVIPKMIKYYKKNSK